MSQSAHVSLPLCCPTATSKLKNIKVRLVCVHFADEPILVDGSALFALSIPRCLGPHLLDVLQHHVAMSVKRLDSRKQLAVVAT
jgi:hypothetical protein